jgi:hypothetical protein
MMRMMRRIFWYSRIDAGWPVAAAPWRGGGGTVLFSPSFAYREERKTVGEEEVVAAARGRMLGFAALVWGLKGRRESR